MITSRTWAGKRYAVLGLARSGKATVDALLASGAEVVAWDSDEAKRNQFLPGTGRGTAEGGGGAATLAEPATEVRLPLHHPAGGPPVSGRPVPRTGLGLPGAVQPDTRAGEDLAFADPLTLDLTGFTAVVVSPGVPLNRHPIAAHAAKFGVPVIGDIELFAQARAELPPHKVVGITGTNGKSTTTALVHHILAGAGVPTTMGGNIGLPILGQEPLPAGGVYVLELSSFQIDLTFTLDCDVAVLLNITPDHLDRYENFDAYLASKIRLFEMQSEQHLAVHAEDAWFSGKHYDKAEREVLHYFLKPEDMKLPNQQTWPSLQGPHNAENAAAAIHVCRLVGIIEDVVSRALQSFAGLPHRTERVRERDGVTFVNDSKATNPTSTAPALAAYPAIRWILGGQAKTTELDACAPHFGHVRSAYTIGDAAPMFADLLRPHMPIEHSGTLDIAVAHAARDALPGDTVLLSPACASFDQFRDYEDRGDQFRKLVEAL